MAESLGSLDKVDLMEAQAAWRARSSCRCGTCWPHILDALNGVGDGTGLQKPGYEEAVAAVLASRADRRAMAESEARKRDAL